MTLYNFLAGAVSFGFFACALLFIRFWRRTSDQLFMTFGLSFALLGVGQSLLALAPIPTEERASIYIIRLIAFALIIFAIARKNRSEQSPLS
jgi:hypothetical protein